MNRKLAKKIIREVGEEYKYTVSGDVSDSKFDVYFDRSVHGIAFQIRHTTHPRAEEEGWLQVHHFEGGQDEWGPALHSLRTIGDVIAFCQTLITFEKIISKRKD